MTRPPPPPLLRPADVCRRLLAALDASEGRRRRRKRDTTPDAIGMAIKRRLLDDTVRGDPEPDDYEGWLLERCLAAGGTGQGSAEAVPSGPLRAMARDILGEWRLAQASGEFRDWLADGAPSDDNVRSPQPDAGGVAASVPPRGTSCTSSPTRTDTDRSAPPPAPPRWRGPPGRASC